MPVDIYRYPPKVLICCQNWKEKLVEFKNQLQRGNKENPFVPGLSGVRRGGLGLGDLRKKPEFVSQLYDLILQIPESRQFSDPENLLLEQRELYGDYAVFIMYAAYLAGEADTVSRETFEEIARDPRIREYLATKVVPVDFPDYFLRLYLIPDCRTLTTVKPIGEETGASDATLRRFVDYLELRQDTGSIRIEARAASHGEKRYTIFINDEDLLAVRQKIEEQNVPIVEMLDAAGANFEVELTDEKRRQLEESLGNSIDIYPADES